MLRFDDCTKRDRNLSRLNEGVLSPDAALNVDCLEDVAIWVNVRQKSVNAFRTEFVDTGNTQIITIEFLYLGVSIYSRIEDPGGIFSILKIYPKLL